ncbi:glutamine amidotransferase [Natrialba chahannaoensis JCM 10990]|uniref:anthranilate synthase n=1 Tax=Natrialba chahannaoensis JCM 10990 TaxID=1227492 RepID=M0A3P1_9EURY|nr:aminodeoxychorismate/anthranilate synthase component II [Natrialba chahannaoensis]ELY93214.1 glutamine amidotransferase [Natrialba chahannaoensis JCM 10990]
MSNQEPTRLLVVDNYDSFVYNLVQYVGEVADEVIVRRNDELDLAAVRELDPTGIIVSPGPGTPEEAGVSIPLFAETEYPILGVCLGHQALCAANGAPVGHAPDVVHGKPSTISHDGEGVFAGLPDHFQVGRYHSLAVERDDLPASVVETARTTDEREISMAVRHREKPHIGVQFHPESILTRALDSEHERRGHDETGATATDETDGTDDTDGIELTLGKQMIGNFCEFAADTTQTGATEADTTEMDTSKTDTTRTDGERR